MLPIAAATPTERSAIDREMRAPKIIRVHRSRPKLSVPSHWAADGPAKRWRMSICSTSWVARRGAKTAASTMASVIRPPTTSEVLRSARGSHMALRKPHARVDHCVGQVDDQVHESEHECIREYHALDEREVALRDRRDGQLPK